MACSLPRYAKCDASRYCFTLVLRQKLECPKSLAPHIYAILIKGSNSQSVSVFVDSPHSDSYTSRLTAVVFVCSSSLLLDTRSTQGSSLVRSYCEEMNSSISLSNTAVRCTVRTCKLKHTCRFPVTRYLSLPTNVSCQRKSQIRKCFVSVVCISLPLHQVFCLMSPNMRRT